MYRITPKEKRSTGEQPLIGTRLEFLINLDHELVRLAQTINWDAIAAEFRPMYCPDNGRPAVPTRLMAGLQLLKHVSGRNVDVFRTRDQTLVDGEYFTHLLYFRPWVWKFQVVQRSHEEVLFKVVGTNGQPPSSELDDIAAKARLVMGPDCRIDFEFLPDLPPHPSGNDLPMQKSPRRAKQRRKLRRNVAWISSSGTQTPRRAKRTRNPK